MIGLSTASRFGRIYIFWIIDLEQQIQDHNAMISLFAFCLFLISTIVTFCLFDSLVKIEFKRHRGHWILDGKPIGFFWQPKQTGESFSSLLLLGSVARSRRSLEWLFRTPEWAVAGEEEGTRLRNFRVSGYSAMGLGVLWIGVVFLR